MVVDPELAPEVKAFLQVERSVIRIDAATRARALARAREVMMAAAPAPASKKQDPKRSRRLLTVVVAVLVAAAGATAGYGASSYLVSKRLTVSRAPNVASRADRPHLP